tara:strand:+ start:5212 stop:5517 length:306 start_codon:yes stop_codon:yes gene_type:complete
MYAEHRAFGVVDRGRVEAIEAKINSLTVEIREEVKQTNRKKHNRQRLYDELGEEFSDFCSPTEAGEILGISNTAVISKALNGDIAAVKVAGNWYFLKDELK